jgi:hypothetical protein
MGAIKGKKLEQIVCPFCVYSSKRITAVEQHIVDHHEKTPMQAWVEINGVKLCKCGCGSQTKWINWKLGFSDFINGHNASIYSYLEQSLAEEIVKKRSDSLRESMKQGLVISWSKGLTKDTSKILSNAAKKRSETVTQQFASGDRQIWSKGLTKTTDERVANFSKNLKEEFANGTRKPWSLGLTKDSDQRVKEMAVKVSLSLRKESLRKRLDQYKRLKEDEIKLRIEDNSQLRVVGGLEQYVNDASPVIKVKCNLCNAEFYDSLRRLQKGRCYICQPAGSVAQQEISDYISLMGLSIKRNDRVQLDGQELDIFIPSHNLAVEYNGLYWHSDLHKSSIYHQNKSKLAGSKGVQLVHVFEDDWRDRPDIVKSMILHRLKLTSRKIGARKLRLAKLDKKTREEFFESNHIDGDVASLVAWGLFSEKELIAALSVRKPFHKSHGGYYEVARFCTKTYTHVPGALRKLTKIALEFTKANSKLGLMTYVDRRFGSGEGYQSSGFEKINETPPRFWWTDFENRYNRFKFKADPARGMSEADVAAEIGVVKIWGCSNLIYRVKT